MTTDPSQTFPSPEAAWGERSPQPGRRSNVLPLLATAVAAGLFTAATVAAVTVPQLITAGHAIDRQVDRIASLEEEVDGLNDEVLAAEDAAYACYNAFVDMTWAYDASIEAWNKGIEATDAYLDAYDYDLGNLLSGEANGLSEKASGKRADADTWGCE